MATIKGGLLDKDNSAFEIEENGIKFMNRKTSSQMDASLLSMPLVNLSVDLGEITNPDESYLVGALLMLATTTAWAIIHVSAKIMYSNSPEMTGYDTISVMGYALAPSYYFYAKYKGVNVNLFSFPLKIRVLLIVRVIVGLVNNLVFFTGLRYISVGKGVLIFSLSPFF